MLSAPKTGRRCQCLNTEQFKDKRDKSAGAEQAQQINCPPLSKRQRFFPEAKQRLVVGVGHTGWSDSLAESETQYVQLCGQWAGTRQLTNQSVSVDSGQTPGS